MKSDQRIGASQLNREVKSCRTMRDSILMPGEHNDAGGRSWHDQVDGVLFDLDGTLVDSAPDLAGAVNRMRIRRGLVPMSYGSLRPYASQGAAGLLGAGFEIDASHSQYVAMREEFLSEYQNHATDQTRLFDGVQVVLDELKVRGLSWGIVTNKHERFTRVVVQALGLQSQAQVIVSGDTTAHSKPHPEPLEYAARSLGVPCARLLYVGDDVRDIEAARAAGFAGAIAVRYGYAEVDTIDAWGADGQLDDIRELLSCV